MLPVLAEVLDGARAASAGPRARTSADGEQIVDRLRTPSTVARPAGDGVASPVPSQCLAHGSHRPTPPERAPARRAEPAREIAARAPAPPRSGLALAAAVALRGVRQRRDRHPRGEPAPDGVAADRASPRSRRCSSAAACGAAPSRGALLGLGLLAGFAGWSGALDRPGRWRPTRAGSSLNRAITYALVAALGLVLGSSLPRAAERVALGYLAIATAAARSTRSAASSSPGSTSRA